MFYVYILESQKDKTYYIGYTTNIEQRLWKHNFGRTRYSSRKRPWKLIWAKEFLTKAEALEKEKYLKSLKSRRYLKDKLGL